jgi:hypothetical protein
MEYCVVGSVVVIWFTLKEKSDFDTVKAEDGGAFKFDRKEVIKYCLTTILFTTSGVVIPAVFASFQSRWYGIGFLLVSLCAMAATACYWLRQKIFFQQADAPYLYRLASYPQYLKHPTDSTLIENLVRDKSSAVRHILLVGALGSGKTSLGIGIATEFAFRLGVARFISMIKLTQCGLMRHRIRKGLHPNTTFDDGRTLWPLQLVELLVIDDLDGGTGTTKLILPEDVRSALLHALGDDYFTRLGRHGRTVWIASDVQKKELWRDMISGLLGDGGSGTEVHTVELRVKP